MNRNNGSEAMNEGDCPFVENTLEPIREKSPTPAFVRLCTLVMGVFLTGDGMRRFILPGSDRDLYLFWAYILMGALCLGMAGYSRSFLLGNAGLVRENSIWGQKREYLLLAWADMTKIVCADSENAFFEGKGVRWRLRLDGIRSDGSPEEMKNKGESALWHWVRCKRPDLGPCGK